jgi:tetratricopeptide (TPR) repeat protein
MGNLEMERGALEEAQQDYKRSEGINRKTAYERGLAHALVGQGDVLVAQNDLGGGIRLYREALKLVEGADEPEVLTNVHDSLGFAELLQGQSQAAVGDLQQALDLAVKRGDHGNATLTLAWLARVEEANGNAADAVATASRAIAESKLQFSPACNLIASIARARAELSRGQGAAVRLELQNSAAAAQRYGYLPLALEARILLARTTGSPADRRRLLSALAQEALTHGWKQLAAEARKA